MKEYFCIDNCGKEVSGVNRKCHSCDKLNRKIVHPITCLCPFCKAKRGEFKGINNPNYNDKKVRINKCVDCNVIISLVSIRCKSCDDKKRHKLGILNSKKENNPKWIVDRDLFEYGSEFDNNLKEQVRMRDGYKCKLCSCSQLENGRQLDCHHIDYNKKNNNINNLISLCRSCHMKTNVKVENRNKQKYFLKNRVGV